MLVLDAGNLPALLPFEWDMDLDTVLLHRAAWSAIARSRALRRETARVCEETAKLIEESRALLSRTLVPCSGEGVVGSSQITSTRVLCST
jgi:hypothetical protein